jgi:hypothetical protein
MGFLKVLFFIFSFSTIVQTRPIFEEKPIIYDSAPEPTSFDPTSFDPTSFDPDIDLIKIALREPTLLEPAIELLEASFSLPSPKCDVLYCGSLYTPTTVHIDSCYCNETTHTYFCPSGYKELHMSYNMTSFPISQNIYQQHTLVGSCPKGLLCNKRISVNPNYSLMITIFEYPNEDVFTIDGTINGTINGTIDGPIHRKDSDTDDDDVFELLFFP